MIHLVHGPEHSMTLSKRWWKVSKRCEREMTFRGVNLSLVWLRIVPVCSRFVSRADADQFIDRWRRNSVDLTSHPTVNDLHWTGENLGAKLNQSRNHVVDHWSNVVSDVEQDFLTKKKSLIPPLCKSKTSLCVLHSLSNEDFFLCCSRNQVSLGHCPCIFAFLDDPIYIFLTVRGTRAACSTRILVNCLTKGSCKLTIVSTEFRLISVVVEKEKFVKRLTQSFFLVKEQTDVCVWGCFVNASKKCCLTRHMLCVHFSHLRLRLERNLRAKPLARTAWRALISQWSFFPKRSENRKEQ